MSDFLLELRCEEIPARMQAGARADLEKLFAKEMAAAGVAVGAITVWSTPRRLALIARGLPLATSAVSEEAKGPRTSAPEQALEGFLRKTGLTRDQLTERDGVWFAVTEKPGRATRDVLAEAIPAIVRAFPWPKSQRWGAASISTESLRWVRPLSGIVAILGEDLVPCEVGSIHSGYATKGHRFHAPHEITIGSAADYQDKLRACHVIVDHEERQDLIRERAKAAAEAEGLTLVEDEGLVIENAGLTEWPVPLLGRFDEAYLEVPPEVIQLTARTNQKYFVCEQDGKLANAFVCTANIAAVDGGTAIVAGNRKVLAARLSDASFFWQQDRKTTLVDQFKKLERITFHEKLGTVADKSVRIAKLARWFIENEIIPWPEPDQADLAGKLCKADLVSEMVGEFPELQGLMGGYYALAEGFSEEVANAMRDHYKPVGLGDEVPTAPLTVAVSLADKLDTLVGFWAINQRPTGSRDPFALRRAAIGIIAQIVSSGIRVSLGDAIKFAAVLHFAELAMRGLSASEFLVKQTTALAEFVKAGKLNAYTTPIFEQFERTIADTNSSPHIVDREQVREFIRDLKSDKFHRDVMEFVADRLKVQQKEAGVRHDLIDAVFALGGEDDLVRLLARVHALQAFVGTEDGTNLLAGYKRAANILKKETFESGAINPAPEPAEQALADALDAAGPKAAAAIEAEDFAGAMAALATLRAPIDAFFENVTVNDADVQKRAARLSLLAAFRDAVHRVADFSKIEG